MFLKGKKRKIRILQYLILLLITVLGTDVVAQVNANYWKSSIYQKSNNTRSISNAKYYELNNELIEQELDSHPENSVFSLVLPMPDGNFETFVLHEVSMMESALANKYPNIKTYRGYSSIDPSIIIGADMSSRGFHAFIVSNAKEIRIEPQAVGDQKTHVVYHTKDKHLHARPTACGFEENSNNLIKMDLLDNTTLLNTNANTNAPEMSSTSVGATLSTYRLAISTRGDLAQGKGWTTTADVMTNVVSLMNEVNTIFERDLAITFTLVANTDLLFYLDPSTDPFSSAYLSENQTAIDAAIGDANYDIGHMLKPNSGGLAVLPCVCSSGSKAKGYSSYDYLKTVCHEFGHQLGSGHSFNTETGSCSGNRYTSTAYEPGSGSTIMSYSGLCSPNNVTNPGTTTYFNIGAYDRITTYANAGGNCYTSPSTGNNPPVVTVPTSGFYIPISTPFELVGSATDADGHSLDYSWEQYDLGDAGDINVPVGDAPIFRVFNPVSTGTRTFPQISDIVSNTTTDGEILPSYSRNLTFRLLVRDNNKGADYGEVAFQSDATAGPFLVTSPNTAVSWLEGSTQTITWDVASTNNANVNCQNVNILLSSDGGLTYPTTLISNTANDGSQSVTMPSGGNCGSTFRIRIEAGDNIFFDISDVDFAIETDISNQSVSNLTTTTVDLTWATTSSTHFDIEHGVKGYTQGAGTTVSNINATTYNLTGLTASTEYDYYVRVNPSSCWVGPYSFATLTCSEQSFPYSEDFENSGSFPSCWVNLSSDDQDWTVTTGSTGTSGSGPSSAHSNSYYIYYEVSGVPGDDEALLLGPSFDLTGANAPSFCFYYHMYGQSMGTLELEIESPVGSSNWTSVWSKSGQQHSSNSTAYTQACVDLSAYTGQTLRVRFKGTHLQSDQPWGDMAFDLIEFTPCEVPTDISGSNILETSADISWTSAGGNTWDLEYGTKGFTQGTGTFINDIGTSSQSLSSLIAGTEYDVYVRTHCSGGGLKSEWTKSFSFATLTCAEQSFPYSEDFENGGSLPSCWVNLSSDNQNWTVNSGGTGTSGSGPSNAHSNTYYLYYEVSSISANDEAILLGPSFNLAGAVGPSFCFYYHMYGQSMGTLELEIESPVGRSEWTSVWSKTGEQHGSNGASYTQACVDLSGYIGQTIRLRFKGTHLHNSSPWGDMAFDLLTFTITGLPIELMSFEANLTNEKNIALNWVTQSEMSNKGFYIQRSADGKGWQNIGFVQGNGTTQERKDYTFIDETPLNSTNYYRLKQIDYDGQFEYSMIEVVEIETGEKPVNIYPNPVMNELNIVNGEGQAIIYNMLGQQVKKWRIDNRELTINTSDLVQGQYILYIQKENGNVITKRFVK